MGPWGLPRVRPVHKAVELIGRRWSGAIIQILRQRPARYAELRAAMPDITDRMLSAAAGARRRSTSSPAPSFRVDAGARRGLADREGAGAGAGARRARALGRALGRSGGHGHSRCRSRGQEGAPQAGRGGRLAAQRRRPSPPLISSRFPRPRILRRQRPLTAVAHSRSVLENAEDRLRHRPPSESGATGWFRLEEAARGDEGTFCEDHDDKGICDRGDDRRRDDDLGRPGAAGAAAGRRTPGWAAAGTRRRACSRAPGRATSPWSTPRPRTADGRCGQVSASTVTARRRAEATRARTSCAPSSCSAIATAAELGPFLKKGHRLQSGTPSAEPHRRAESRISRTSSGQKVNDGLRGSPLFQVQNILTGDAKAGQAFFTGRREVRDLPFANRQPRRHRRTPRAGRHPAAIPLPGHGTAAGADAGAGPPLRIPPPCV